MRLSIFALLAIVPAAQASILWSNGEWYGGQVHSNGDNISVRPAGATDRGWPTDWSTGGAFDSASEDFKIGAGGAKLEKARLFLYEINGGPTTLSFERVFVRIWNTKPSGARLTNNADPRIVGGAIPTGTRDQALQTPFSTPIASRFTGVYRVDDATSTVRTRAIWEVDMNLSFLPTLSEGTYWIEVSTLGTAGAEAWLPVIPGNEPAGQDPTVDISGGNYVTASPAGGRARMDLAFEIHGQPVPEPATCLALAAGAGFLLRRRRG